jgi:hypothetical protein
MEFMTPEEIAREAVLEIQGANTGHDVIAAIDGAVMNPTYRAGYLRHFALEEITRLERETDTHWWRWASCLPERVAGRRTCLLPSHSVPCSNGPLTPSPRDTLVRADAIAADDRPGGPADLHARWSGAHSRPVHPHPGSAREEQRAADAGERRAVGGEGLGGSAPAEL